MRQCRSKSAFLADKRLDPALHEMINVVVKGGLPWSLDNRRFFALVTEGSSDPSRRGEGKSPFPSSRAKG